jgi:putative flippase GtrA
VVLGGEATVSDSLPRQIARFLASGVAASGTHYALYLALVAAGLLGPAPATVVGFCAGTLVSYALNSRYTFAVAGSRSTFARFWVVTLLGGALNTGLVMVLAGHLHYAPAGVVAIVAAAAFNFTGHRLWTFRPDA